MSKLIPTQFRLTEIERQFLAYKADGEGLSIGLKKIFDETGFKNFQQEYLKKNKVFVLRCTVANMPEVYAYILVAKTKDIVSPKKTVLIEKERLNLDGKVKDDLVMNFLEGFFHISPKEPREIIIRDSDTNKLLWTSEKS